MSNILYYPYINLPRSDWTLRILLYYDNVGSIVPQEYFYDPAKHYDEFMLELVRNELVTPINPMDIFDKPWEVSKPFLELVEKNQDKLMEAQRRFRTSTRELIQNDKFTSAQIHADKFDDNVFNGLLELGLAERTNGNWYSVEKRTANCLMSYLATLIGVKTDRLPTTDYIRPIYRKFAFHNEQQKRETILTKLIPFPEEINLGKLLKFKEKHSQLLNTFRTKVEIIALDPHIMEGTPLFHQHLAELLQRKEELSAKMKESQFTSIVLGTVCGLIGAYQGIATASTTSAVIGGLPGFASAVYSALKIERAEDMFDQSGLKYLALADKRIRQ